MSLIHRNDFSAGLCPSDGYFNGRENALLRMDNCYLDENGSLQMVRGSTQIASALVSPVNYIFSTVMQAAYFRYLGLANGNVLRDVQAGNFSSPVTVMTGTTPRTRFGVAFGNVLISNGTVRVKDPGTSLTPSLPLPTLGLLTPTGVNVSQVGGGTAGNIKAGTYQYLCQYVNEGSNYAAASAFSPITTVSVADAAGPGSGGQVSVLLFGGSPNEPQANFVYIYRFGNTLDQFYFVGKSPYASGVMTPFTDNNSDATLLQTNIKPNRFLQSVNSITDEIIGIAGPIQGRMVYLTFKQLYISDQYNIDAFDSRKVIKLSSGSGQTGRNLFINQFPLSLLIVGATEDMYELSGTFSDLPDGTMDVVIRPFGAKQPPINETFDVYNNILYYLAMDGIRALQGVTPILTSQELRLLFRTTQLPGVSTRYGAQLFQTQAGNALPYRICVNNNRMYFVVAQADGSFSTYVNYLGNTDGSGRYWYRLTSNPNFLFSEEDGTLLGGFASSLQKLDDTNSTTFAGTAIPVNLVFPYTKQEPNQRKDLYTLRFHALGGPVTVFLGNEVSSDSGTPTNNTVNIGTINTTTLSDVSFNISTVFPTLNKRFLVILSGNPTTNFTLVDWSIDYNPRPEPLNHLRQPATNYGLPGKKRLRTLPFVIDTLSNNVTVHAIIDGVDFGAQTVNTAEKTTAFYYLSTDVFGTDVILTFDSVDPTKQFEFYEALPPVNVETLPTGKLFDQIGPLELERIGALLEFRTRLVATGTSINYNIFMDDVKITSGSFVTIPNVDKSYGPIKTPKGTQGSVCRIEFSATTPFYRWNCKPKFTVGGIKSDTKQLVIQDASMGVQK